MNETKRLSYAAERSESPIEYNLAASLLESYRFVIVPQDSVEQQLERYEIAFIMQYPVDRYRLDIALFFRALDGQRHRIAIECDGKRFHTGATYEARDRDRDNYLASKGFQVWRYPGWLLHHSPGVAADEIQRACEALINGGETALTFSRGRDSCEPTPKEFEQAFWAYWDGVPWPPRMGETPRQRGWLCPEDLPPYQGEQA